MARAIVWALSSLVGSCVLSNVTQGQVAAASGGFTSTISQPTNSLEQTKLTSSSVKVRGEIPVEPSGQTGVSHSDVLISASPDNFNPGLQLPPPEPEQIKPSPPAPSPLMPVFRLESIQTDFRLDQNNFDEYNQFIEATARFQLRNGNELSIRTGRNTFDQSEVGSITNIPIQIGWEGKLGSVNLRAAAGADFFDRLPTSSNLNVQADIPISPSVTLSAVVEQGPYKFNAKTLDNRISAWRFGPNLYWQIDSKSSFFSLLRLGSYSDGNFEVQSFSRLERKMGQFFVAVNLFTWSYEDDVQDRKGYFSPPDFLVYNGEIGWEGNVFKFLRCRLTTNLGQQRLNGRFDVASTSQARCTAKLSPTVELDLGYAFSNLQNRNTRDGNYESDSITGQLRIKF